MKYRGYTIKKSGFNYVVITPKGEQWAEQAANHATAKKWIDVDLRDRQNAQFESQDRQKIENALLHFAETGAVRALNHPDNK